MSQFVTKVNDTKHALKCYLNSGGVPLDLTNCEVIFVMSDYSGKITKIKRNATIVDAQAGEVFFQFRKSDIEVPGTYLGEFIVVYSDMLEETFPNEGYIIIKVNGNLPGRG